MNSPAENVITIIYYYFIVMCSARTVYKMYRYNTKIRFEKHNWRYNRMTLYH